MTGRNRIQMTWEKNGVTVSVTGDYDAAVDGWWLSGSVNGEGKIEPRGPTSDAWRELTDMVMLEMDSEESDRYTRYNNEQNALTEARDAITEQEREEAYALLGAGHVLEEIRLARDFADYRDSDQERFPFEVLAFSETDRVGVSHGCYETLEDAQGCVEFDGLTDFQIWDRGQVCVVDEKGQYGISAT